MLYFSFYFVTPLLPLYLRDVFDADKAMIGLVLSGYSIAALAIRFFSGYIVDRFSRKKVLLIGFASFALFFLGYYFTFSLVLFAVIRTLHGAPFGLTSVSSSTVAIDVLPSKRRGEGIGYWGLSNNFAMAVGPSLSLWIFTHYDNYNILFTVSLVTALIGLLINTTVDCKYRPPVLDKKKIPYYSCIKELNIDNNSFKQGYMVNEIPVVGINDIKIEDAIKKTEDLAEKQRNLSKETEKSSRKDAERLLEKQEKLNLKNKISKCGFDQKQLVKKLNGVITKK